MICFERHLRVVEIFLMRCHGGVNDGIQVPIQGIES